MVNTITKETCIVDCGKGWFLTLEKSTSWSYRLNFQDSSRSLNVVIVRDCPLMKAKTREEAYEQAIQNIFGKVRVVISSEMIWDTYEKPKEKT